MNLQKLAGKLETAGKECMVVAKKQIKLSFENHKHKCARVEATKKKAANTKFLKPNVLLLMQKKVPYIELMQNRYNLQCTFKSSHLKGKKENNSGINNTVSGVYAVNSFKTLLRSFNTIDGV
jgi:hypothetical protein